MKFYSPQRVIFFFILQNVVGKKTKQIKTPHLNIIKTVTDITGENQTKPNKSKPNQNTSETKPSKPKTIFH